VKPAVPSSVDLEKASREASRLAARHWPGGDPRVFGHAALRPNVSGLLVSNLSTTTAPLDQKFVDQFSQEASPTVDRISDVATAEIVAYFESSSTLWAMKHQESCAGEPQRERDMQ
jgi:hypothetical protein